VLRWKTDQGRSFLTFIVKVTYSLADGRIITPRPFSQLDRGPYKPFAEVVVEGPIRRAPLPHFRGIAIARGADIILQKMVVAPSRGPLAGPGDRPLAGDAPRDWAESSELPPSLSDAGDTRIYQQAPEDQWLPHLAGGEQIRLVGFESVEDEFVFRLPQLMPRGVVNGPSSDSRCIPFVADTLSIETVLGVVSVTHRGSVEWPLALETPQLGDRLEIAIQPVKDDGKALGRPAAWIQARGASKNSRSPVVQPFNLENLTPFAAQVRVWKPTPGEARRLVFLKGAFDISPDGRSLSLAETQPPLEGDRLGADGALERASDFAPFKQELDLVIRGTARAVGGAAKTVVRVELGTLRASFDASSDAPVRLGPIAPTHPARQPLFGTFDDGWLDERWPYLPADVDPRAFQVALPLLRTPMLRPDARLVVAGLLEGGRTIDVPLPTQRPHALALSGPKSEVADVALQLDTLLLDADAMRLEIVWRGSYPVVEGGTEEPSLLLVRDRETVGSAAVDHAVASLRAPIWRDAVSPTIDASSLRPLKAARAHWSELTAALLRLRSAPGPARPPPRRAEILADVAAGKNFLGRDLARAELSGADLRGADLRGVILRGASLEGARLDGSDLRGAVLAGASLAGASLVGAKLSRADLRAAKAQQANFCEAELDHTNFSRANLAEAILTGAGGTGTRFVEADLTRTRLDSARLTKADFSKASMEAASFVESDLTDGKFYESQAPGATFERATLKDARFELAALGGSRFDGAKASASTWDSADLAGCTFTAANLAGAVFSGANLKGATLANCSAERASFRFANLTQADARDADLRGASLEEAVLDGASFEATNMEGAEFSKGVTLAHARFSRATVTGTRLAKAERTAT
jgi:uncharacterized protein YjbI with pentapeptide repeats